MSDSTARHARERAAVAAATQNLSRETLRKAKCIVNTFVDGGEALQSGKYSVDELYKLAKGDTRVGLYVKVSPVTRDMLRLMAMKRGVTVAELFETLVTQIFGEGGDA